MLITLSVVSSSLFAQGNCLDFDGSNDYTVSLSVGSLSNKTLSAWVKLDDINQDGSGVICIETANGHDFDTITYNETLSGIGWGFGSDGWQRTSWSGIKETSTEEWVHIAATYEDWSFKIYRNGSLIHTHSTDLVRDFPSDTKVYIGVRCWSGFGFLDGKIDEVRVWNYVRTQTEIQEDMNSSLVGNESGLVAYYRLDEGTGQITADGTSNSFDTTLGSTSGIDTNDPTWIVSDAPLPVTLSAFTASFSNGSSLLNWTTQSETNNLGWNVYRSETENSEDYFQINEDMIAGAGTSSEQTDYTFADQNEVSPANSYWYWIESVDYGGYTNLHGPARIDIPDTEDELPPELLSAFGLAQNFPNPFNPTTKIAFKLTEENAKNAKLTIYNPKGQIVKIFDDLTTNGNELGSVIWKGDDEYGNAVSSGIYLYKLKTSNNEYSKKMIMIK